MTQGEGRVLAGRYRLDSVLGRGGMGTVWLAKDEVLGRDVAVKEVIAPRGLEDHAREVLYKRLLREARAAARLSHPGIVVVHDVVEEDGAPWIVMEYVRARTLQDSLDSSGPLPVDRVAEIGKQVLGALRAAHAAGILHRDVKPANVMLSDDRVILTDFGVAQLEGDATLTQTGIVMGSPAYLSPERAQGLKPGPASDLWALGMMLYAACEGTPPYERPEVLSTLAAVMMEPLPEPSRAGPLARVIKGLLEKEPEERLDGATAAEMLHRAHAEAKAVPLTPAPRHVPEAQRSGDTYESLFRPLAPSLATTPDPARAASRPAPPPRAPSVPSVPAPRPAETRPAYSETPSPRAAGPGPDRPRTSRRTAWPVYAALAVVLAVVAAGSVYVFRDRVFGTERTWEALGYSITVPKDWERTQYDAQRQFATWTDPDTGAYVQLDLRDWSEGGKISTPSASFEGYGDHFEEYKQTRIETEPLNGSPTTEVWHRFKRNGKWWRAVNRRSVEENGDHLALFAVFPGKNWGKNRTTALNILNSCAS
ncbi:hypothetical protein GCM10022221_56020 [Actinocorallia aurea]